MNLTTHTDLSEGGITERSFKNVLQKCMTRVRSNVAPAQLMLPSTRMPVGDTCSHGIHHASHEVPSVSCGDFQDKGRQDTLVRGASRRCPPTLTHSCAPKRGQKQAAEPSLVDHDHNHASTHTHMQFLQDAIPTAIVVDAK